MSVVIRPSRESVTTIGKDGRRVVLRPADVSGRFTTRRRIVAAVLIAVYVSLPWIQIGGHPAVFLDVARRRFHLFGNTLGLGDLWLLFFGITGLGFTIYAVTSLYGRVWCGWACPQTVFLDHVFRRVERLIEGDASARRALDGLPKNSPERLAKRALKAVAFLVLCWLLAHAFLAYFVSIPGVYAFLAGGPSGHAGAFVTMAVVTGALFFHFWWFREQLCLIVCPYGRLQSALIDDDSVVIGYDVKRGEPRGSTRVTGAGDCVDCRRCVQACPTGIDIRQGLQIECLGCTACVDACDTVMDKLGRPRGLVRHASLRELNGGEKRFLRLRTFAYAALMLVGASVALWAVSGVRDVGFKLTRQPGAPLFFRTDRDVLNVFRMSVQNKTGEARTYRATLEDAPEGAVLLGVEKGLRVEAQKELHAPVTLRVPDTGGLREFAFRIRLVDDAGGKPVVQEGRFVSPGNGK